MKRATAPPPSTCYTVRARLKLKPMAFVRRLHTQPAMSGARRTNTKREKTRGHVAITFAAPSRVWHREASRCTALQRDGKRSEFKQITFAHGKLEEGVAWKAVQRMVSVEEQKTHPRGENIVRHKLSDSRSATAPPKSTQCNKRTQKN